MYAQRDVLYQISLIKYEVAPRTWNVWAAGSNVCKYGQQLTMYDINNICTYLLLI